MGGFYINSENGNPYELAVTKAGKIYESAISLDCDAKNFHAALLLINSKSGKISYPQNPDDDVKVSGDTLLLDIVYVDKNKKQKIIPALDIISYRDSTSLKKEKELKKDIHWIFTGSRTVDVNGKGKLVHESIMTGSLIAIFIDEAAEINFSKQTKNPYQGDNMGFKINSIVLKQLGNNYLLRIKKI